MNKHEIYTSLCVTNINNYLSQIVLVNVKYAKYGLIGNFKTLKKMGLLLTNIQTPG